ncbi:MAG: CBS domain-containing protein [Thermoanaerobaculia bacterium]
MRCPFCAHQNLQGSELCEQCGADLAGLDLPEAGRGVGGRLLTDRLGDLPLAPVLELAPEATVAEAVALMRRERHGCVLVRYHGELVGIFTEWDLLTRVLLPGLEPGATALGEVMTADPVRLEASDPPAFAVHLMVARELRHVPVVDGGQLLGFVSVRNLLRYIRHQVTAA